MPPLSRRTVLKGLGATMALPILDSMVSKKAWATPQALAPNRMAFVYCPNGAIMEHWIPEQTGTAFTLPKTLAPLQHFQSDINVISGLAQDNARAKTDGPGDHARDSAVFLTSARPFKSDSTIRIGQSIDQYAAERIGSQTRLSSLEIGIEAGRQAGNCDSGYSCAYSSNISWKSATIPMAKEVRPKQVFERLFGADLDPETQARRAYQRKSILDFVADDRKALTKQVGANDKRKLDEYFSSVRSIEDRIARASQDRGEIPEMQLPPGIPQDFATHVKLMYDLMLVAFQTDTTRICTFMLGNSGSNRAYKEIDVVEGHHQISHHQKDPTNLANLQKIDQYMMEQFAYFLGQLKETKEGDSNLLANSMIMYGSAIADPDRHNHDDLPILIAGQGRGAFDTGRHIRFQKETPLSNLYVSMLNGMHIENDGFGDSTGSMSELKIS